MMRGPAVREPGTVTKLLLEMRGGDSQAASQLWSMVYRELRWIAADMMQRERPGHTLQPPIRGGNVSGVRFGAGVMSGFN